LAAYEQSLQWVPLRTPSIAGLAKAAASSGDAATAEEMLSKLKAMPGISEARTMIR